MMRLGTVAMAMLLVTAGCLGSTDSNEVFGQDDPSDQPQKGEIVERTIVFTADLEQPDAGGDRLGVEWGTRLGTGLLGLEVELSWTEQANRFGLETERPDGTVHKTSPPEMPGPTSIEGNVTEAEPGRYSFYLTAAEGIVLPDNVTLKADATFRIVDGSPVVDGGTIQGPLRTERTDDGWRAEIRYHANGSASTRMTVDVDTTNGGISHSGNADQARATVLAWGRADTEDKAIERVRSIRVDLTVDSGEVVAHAEAPEWRKRGASVQTGVPSSTTTDARLDTTNGQISLSNAIVDGLVADTTNGGVQGTVTGAGDLLMDTTNGRIDVDLNPTGDTSLTADTTNGGIDLGLTETDDIAYEIHASTTNGDITEQMDEAHLEGSDDEATLVTENGQGRPIQVTGDVGTTNGHISFVGR